MPPLHDDIADALVLIADGASHTISLDNTGATDQGNEATGREPQPGVWATVDLSAHSGTVSIPIDLANTGGDPDFAPEFAVFKVIDLTFDPSAPDFDKLDYISGDTYVGDGSPDPPADILDLEGGTGLSTGDNSLNGIFYLVLNDYNYLVTGSADIEYSVPSPPICIDAPDVINPDSTTASVVGGGTRVREDWPKFEDYAGAPTMQVPNKTLKWTWAGDAGQYQVAATGQAASAAAFISIVSIQIYVNGRAFMRPINQNFSGLGTASESWYVHNGYGFGTSDTEYESSDYTINPWIPLTPGDQIEVMVVSDMTDGSNVFIPFELEKLCFFLDANAPLSSNCTPSIIFDEKPLGDEWGSYRGWGGQKFVPDQIWPEISVTPYDDSPGNYAWGIGFSDFDMCVLPDGTVYVIYMEGVSSAGADAHPGGPFDNHENTYFFVVVKKYDPGTDEWTQVATLNKFDPFTGAGHAGGCLAGPHQAESTSAYYDPINGGVYFGWVEASYYYGSFPDLDAKAYVAKLDPSDDSWSYLGSGVAALGHSNFGSYDRFATLGVTIAVTENEDVYIGTVEVTTDTEPSDPHRHAFVWRWNGSSWTNLSLPRPSNLSDDDWAVDGENQFWDQLVMVSPYRRDGSQDGVTVHYSYVNTGTEPNFWEARRSCTIEYTPGGGWANEILTVWADVERKYPPLKRTNSEGAAADPAEYSTKAIDQTVLWSETLGRLVLVADLQSVGNEIWDMFQMNDAGTQWELLEPDIAPPSSAGPWRQARNCAAIGPDGEIYQATYSDHVEFDFWPHVIKHSPGFGYGFADACRKHIGEGTTTDAQGIVWEGVYVSMEATANHRIIWSGNNVYVIGSLYTEPMNLEDIPEDDGDAPFADGVFVMKGTYVPCATFRPHFYRRVLG